MLTASPEGSTSTDVIIAKISIMLAPELPLRLRDLCLFPDGAPKAIFYALRKGSDTKVFHELFSSELIKLWYLEQEHMRSPANAAEFRIYINRQDIGYGLDRIMYDFDDDIPCVSPLLGDEFVNSPTRILRALDNTYARQIVKSMPYDRNIIAYLRCKMGKKSTVFLPTSVQARIICRPAPFCACIPACKTNSVRHSCPTFLNGWPVLRLQSSKATIT